ncbi:MAG: hypothetical protein ACD_79C00496G0008 [uncultured bacterium]|nr:MAG: hypothetical protein ACD_79C00496G0008 [uncultured bacterium]
MKEKAEIEFEILTPCFCAGNDPKGAEIRATSIKGMMHWWYRALYGGFDDERKIFGGIEIKDNEIKEKLSFKDRRSSIDIKITDFIGDEEKNITENKITSIGPKYLLYGMEGRCVIKKGNFKLTLKKKPLFNEAKELDDNFILMFSLLFSLGSRSRKGFGSLWPKNIIIDGQRENIPENKVEFIDAIKSKVISKDMKMKFISQGEVSSKDALNKIHDFLYQKDRRQGNEKGDKDRIPSPLLFKVIKLENKYFPLLIVFKNQIMNDPKKPKRKQVWDKIYAEMENLNDL